MRDESDEPVSGATVEVQVIEPDDLVIPLVAETGEFGFAEFSYNTEVTGTHALEILDVTGPGLTFGLGLVRSSEVFVPVAVRVQDESGTISAMIPSDWSKTTEELGGISVFFAAPELEPWIDSVLLGEDADAVGILSAIVPLEEDQAPITISWLEETLNEVSPPDNCTVLLVRYQIFDGEVEPSGLEDHFQCDNGSVFVASFRYDPAAPYSYLVTEGLVPSEEAIELFDVFMDDLRWVPPGGIYVDPILGFTLEIPSGWTTHASTVGEVSFAGVALDEHSILTVQRIDDSAAVPLEELFEQAIAKLQEDTEDYQEIFRDALTLGDYSALESRFVGIYGPGDVVYELEGRLLVVDADGTPLKLVGTVMMFIPQPNGLREATWKSLYSIRSIDITRPSQEPEASEPTCGYTFAYLGHPELSARIESALDTTGQRGAAVSSEAFGENRFCDGEVVGFGAMETAISVTLDVDALPDITRLSTLMSALLSALPADYDPDIGTKYIISFQAGDSKAKADFSIHTLEEVREKQLQGPELLEALGLVTPTPD